MARHPSHPTYPQCASCNEIMTLHEYDAPIGFTWYCWSCRYEVTDITLGDLNEAIARKVTEATKPLIDTINKIRKEIDKI